MIFADDEKGTGIKVAKSLAYKKRKQIYVRDAADATMLLLCKSDPIYCASEILDLYL